MQFNNLKDYITHLKSNKSISVNVISNYENGTIQGSNTQVLLKNTLRFIGKEGIKYIQERIESNGEGDWAPLSEEWAEKRREAGFTEDPLYLTGQILNNIESKIINNSVIIKPKKIKYKPPEELYGKGASSLYLTDLVNIHSVGTSIKPIIPARPIYASSTGKVERHFKIQGKRTVEKVFIEFIKKKYGAS
jgi:hypothetical protein